MNLILKDIIIIKNDYLNYLRNSDSRVLMNHSDGLERPNISVLVDNNGQLWAIPMSHKEFITKDGKNVGESFYSIYIDCEKNPIGGHLKFNNMIPIAENTYDSAFKKYAYNETYLNLLYKQLKVVKDNLNLEITPRFNKALFYRKKAISFNYNDDSSSNGYKKYLQTFLHFEILIEKANNWTLVHKLYNNLDIYIKLQKIDLKAYKAFNHYFNTIQNRKYEDVFRFSSSLTEAYKRFNYYSKYITFINNDIKEQELKKIIPPIIKIFQEYEEIKKQQEKSKNKGNELVR